MSLIFMGSNGARVKIFAAVGCRSSDPTHTISRSRLSFRINQSVKTTQGVLEVMIVCILIFGFLKYRLQRIAIVTASTKYYAHS